jgi:hypothetical protein
VVDLSDGRCARPLNQVLCGLLLRTGENAMTEPTTLTDIIDAFQSLRSEAGAFWGAFDPDTFVAPLGSAWSPADNLRHLIKSTRPVAAALAMPRAQLAERFGQPAAPSRSYAEVREVYRAAVAGGVDAGPFAPSVSDTPTDPSATRAEQLAAYELVFNDLLAALGQWDDGGLDAYQLPHPLIGNLTLREMLSFTHYHHQHHMNNVKKYRASATGTT